MKEIAVKSEGVLPKRAQQIRPKRFTCVYVDNDSVFLELRDHFQGRTGNAAKSVARSASGARSGAETE